MNLSKDKLTKNKSNNKAQDLVEEIIKEATIPPTQRKTSTNKTLPINVPSDVFDNKKNSVKRSPKKSLKRSPKKPVNSDSELNEYIKNMKNEKNDINQSPQLPQARKKTSLLVEDFSEMKRSPKPNKKSPTKKSPTKKSPTKKSPTKKSPTKKSPNKEVISVVIRSPSKKDMIIPVDVQTQKARSKNIPKKSEKEKIISMIMESPCKNKSPRRRRERRQRRVEPDLKINQLIEIPKINNKQTDIFNNKLDLVLERLAKKREMNGMNTSMNKFNDIDLLQTVKRNEFKNLLLKRLDNKLKSWKN
jgi:hypothetical protein